MKILFIPVSSPKGIGEYMRSRILADAFAKHWPGSDIRFMLSKRAPYTQSCPYQTKLTDRSPTLHNDIVNGYISEFKPDLVIFDASGRRSQLKHAKREGATTIFIAQHDRKIRKGMRLSRLINTDLFWIAQPEFTVSPIRAFDRLKLRLLNKQPPRHLGCFFAIPTEQEIATTLNKYQLEKNNYIFVSAGSGAHFVSDNSSAALRFHNATEASCLPLKKVQVWGDNFTQEIPKSDHDINIKSLKNSEFIALLMHSKIALINGGDTLLQALALKKKFLAIPVSADQPHRINSALKAKAEFATSADSVEQMAHALQALFQQIEQPLAAPAVNNGYAEAPLLIERFLATQSK